IRPLPRALARPRATARFAHGEAFSLASENRRATRNRFISPNAYTTRGCGAAVAFDHKIGDIANLVFGRAMKNAEAYMPLRGRVSWPSRTADEGRITISGIKSFVIAYMRISHTDLISEQRSPFIVTARLRDRCPWQPIPA